MASAPGSQFRPWPGSNLEDIIIDPTLTLSLDASLASLGDDPPLILPLIPVGYMPAYFLPFGCFLGVPRLIPD